MDLNGAFGANRVRADAMLIPKELVVTFGGCYVGLLCAAFGTNCDDADVIYIG